MDSLETIPGVTNATVLATTKDWTHDHYSDLRNALTSTGCIGGSMAGAVLGLNPYVSKMRAWFMLSGHLDCEVEETERMWCGRMIEPCLRAMFESRTGLTAIEAPAILVHKDYPWMICTLDGIVSGGVGSKEYGLLELKNTGAYLARHWEGNEIADAAYAQAVHNMAVTGLSFAYVAALIGGNRFEVRRIERDESLIELVTQQEVAFWQSIQDGDPPEWGAQDMPLLDDFFPPDLENSGQVVELDTELLTAVESYHHGAAAEKEGKKVKEDAAAKLKAALGQAEIGHVGEWTVTWKSVQRKEFTVKPSSFRQFRIGQRKG